MDYVADFPSYGSNMDESLVMAQHDHRLAALPDLAAHILHYNPHAMVYYSLFEVVAAAAVAVVLFEVTVEIVAVDVPQPICLRNDLIVALTHHDGDYDVNGDGDDVTWSVYSIMTYRSLDNKLS